MSTWLDSLRRAQIVEAVHGDSRTVGDLLLGIDRGRIFSEIVEGGQADFSADWIDADGHRLSPADRALLYAYFNQPRHLAELTTAMELLTQEARGFENPVVLDIGCGPGTGGLALADALGPGVRFTYVGMDRARSMRDLGEVLARAPQAIEYMRAVERRWTESFATLRWHEAPSWRPVLVIASYLLASPTVEPRSLLEEVMTFVDRVGRGPVVVLYTNSVKSGPNRHFPSFRDTLSEHGFELIEDTRGTICHKGQQMELRYALLRRQARRTLHLEGG